MIRAPCPSSWIRDEKGAVSPSLIIRNTHPNAPPIVVAKTKRNASANSRFPAKVRFAGCAFGLSDLGSADMDPPVPCVGSGRG